MTFWVFKPTELITPTIPDDINKILNLLTLILILYVSVKREEIFKDKSKIYLFSFLFIFLLLLGVASNITDKYTNPDNKIDKNMKVPTFEESMFFSTN